VNAVEEALANQLRDQTSRSVLVRRFFNTVTLTEDNVEDVGAGGTGDVICGVVIEMVSS